MYSNLALMQCTVSKAMDCGCLPTNRRCIGDPVGAALHLVHRVWQALLVLLVQHWYATVMQRVSRKGAALGLLLIAVDCR